MKEYHTNVLRMYESMVLGRIPGPMDETA